ncbi:hypothetical protein PsYK624_115540 [Phanerochaete sordida]|uniref:DUF6535 domain-containing protein n=1 Tax=Phanerochaete sordida TaxID=48140 RepID=A0A9P3GKU2_9APHY|nr:hypothetical protein PsYK624_115540 [Phanerochaete sordida]
MVKTVRDVDTQKVDDTKEDIDTLLVFAGLFSAVVTTFVVATYPSLMPDNTDELVFLMRQSLAQSYTFADGVLRPITPFPADPPFEVPLWALRVNGLWFASLIVSLSTASFGMLVKQWLIEYLAMEQWISPQEQLRARQYRHPALKHWKVFEIAALLPLLLHISLGLFFLGLCFYTTAANETIGRSTFPLVAGWAFFALLTFIAPLASPRCPYKITLLKAGLRAGRRYITSRFWQPGRDAIKGTINAAKWVWSNVICLPYKGYSVLVRWWERLVDVTLDISVVLWIPIFAFSLPFLLFHLVFSYVVKFVVAVVSDPGTDKLEEDDIMQEPYMTHELLLSVDAVIINDGPILETMAEILKQTHASGPDISVFVLGCIQHRIGTANRDTWIPDIDGGVQGLLNLRVLSEAAWAVLAGLMGETLKPCLRDESRASGSPDLWKSNAAAVLLSDSRWPVPHEIRPLLTSPEKLLMIIQLVRLLIVRWPMRDVLRILWIASTALSSESGPTSPEPTQQWDRLSTLTNSNLPELRMTVTQILLEQVWRRDNDPKDATKCSVEAALMLVHILGTALPFVVSDDEQAIPLTLLSHEEQPNLTAGAVLKLLQPNFVGMSTTLRTVVSESMVRGGLSLYAAFISKTLVVFRAEPLWTLIQNLDSDEFWSDAHRPVMRDLWSFLLLCARSSPKAGDSDYLQTHDFVKTCLVLARAGIPRALGSVDPASDWKELVPVLETTVKAGTLIESTAFTTAAARAKTIPTLANRALEELQPTDPDVPQRLLYVLNQLAEKRPKPGTTQILPEESIPLPVTTSGEGQPDPQPGAPGPRERPPWRPASTHGPIRQMSLPERRITTGQHHTTAVYTSSAPPTIGVPSRYLPTGIGGQHPRTSSSGHQEPASRRPSTSRPGMRSAGPSHPGSIDTGGSRVGYPHRTGSRHAAAPKPDTEYDVPQQPQRSSASLRPDTGRSGRHRSRSLRPDVGAETHIARSVQVPSYQSRSTSQAPPSHSHQDRW